MSSVLWRPGGASSSVAQGRLILFAGRRDMAVARLGGMCVGGHATCGAGGRLPCPGGPLGITHVYLLAGRRGGGLAASARKRQSSALVVAFVTG